MTKPVKKLSQVRLIPAVQVFPMDRNCIGKFVAKGKIVDHDERGFGAGDEVRTSLLVSVDLEKGYVETLNTIYLIV